MGEIQADEHPFPGVFELGLAEKILFFLIAKL